MEFNIGADSLATNCAKAEGPPPTILNAAAARNKLAQICQNMYVQVWADYAAKANNVQSNAYGPAQDPSSDDAEIHAIEEQLRQNGFEDDYDPWADNATDESANQMGDNGEHSG